MDDEADAGDEADTDAPAEGGRRGMKRRLLRPKVVTRPTRTPEELDAALAEAAEVTSLEADLAGAEELAREVLRDAGQPESLGPFALLRDGSLRELPDGWRERGYRALERDFGALGLVIVGVVTLDDALHERLPARAARVLRRAEGVRRALAGGRAEDAAWNAVRLGREALFLELDLQGWTKAAEVGDAIGRGGAKGGTTTRQRDSEKAAVRERVVAEAQGQLDRGSSKAAVAGRLARNYELNPETVRDWLKTIPVPSRGRRAKPGG